MGKKHSDYNFSAEKNAYLRAERGISFDEVIAAIENGQALEVIEHPNQKKYPNQDIYVVLVNEYIYMVPFVEQEDGSIFLKTIYPSRKMKKIHSPGGLYEK